MSRSLRPRKPRPNYVSLFQFEDEDGAGPSAPRPTIDEEGDSGSDFAPPEQEEEEDIPDADDAHEDEDHRPQEPEPTEKEVSVDFSTSTPAPKGKGKAPAKQAKPQATASLAPGLSRPHRQMYSLPMPSVHHRHKAIPIFRRAQRVERLVRSPVLFGPNETTPTNSFTFEPAITDRLNKAWGCNVGPGPLWELLEDRGWYKEAVEVEGEEEREGNRRPIVYRELTVDDGWSFLNSEEATPYLPADASAPDELKPPPPIMCSVGPYGKQTSVEFNTFSAINMSDYIPDSTSHVFHAGGPVWGLDWCPIHPEDRPHCSYKQYLAVGPFPSSTHSPIIGVKASRPSNACIQIWSLSPVQAPKVNGDAPDATKASDAGEMKCEMVLCIDSGPAYELKWCPLPSHDPLSEPKSSPKTRKLGLLAGTFEDGSVSVYAVPYPPDLQQDPSVPLFVKPSESLLRIELEEASCWTIEWANSEVIAMGCTNGAIAVYDIGDALRTGRSSSQRIFPTHYMLVHQSAIRALSWIRAPKYSSSNEPLMTDDPSVIASGGYDGVECLTDIHVINSIPFSPYAGGPVTIDHENIIKSYSASPSMLGRGHTLMEPSGPVWPFLVHKVFQLDYSRATRTYRMLERFLPEETADRSSATARAKKGATLPPSSIGAWPAEVGVVRVVWNVGAGLGAASLLASATASGLCRVDWLKGRWMRDKIPYGEVEGIRMEVDSMDVDGENHDDDDDESS
ncbi:hypothetical protein EW146_g4149 [Bondarzewia mesenterica]|uniref:Uncharacterized protein n=1 Tax=Bondarzewia mesenterica TaxID=1095465 RepID=A0A4S4M175_9AGAM|nr:hypothetical protein EW146_g4149 [Bondarzewia mesenterica]